jgi:putative transposase
MCRCLKVSASGYYDWNKRLPSARQLAVHVKIVVA